MLIGIWGYHNENRTSIEAGKDTVARLITEYASSKIDRYQIKTIPFAAKLKEVVADVFGVPLADCYTHEGKETRYEQLHGNTLRYALQYMGTEGFRHVNPHVWANYVVRQDSPDKLILTPDLRFESEAKAIKEAGGYVLGVFRTNNKVLQELLNNRDTYGNLISLAHSDVDAFIKSLINPDPEAHASEQDLEKLMYYTDFVLYNTSDVYYLGQQVKGIADGFLSKLRVAA